MIAALGAQLIAAGHAPSGLDFGADSTLPVTTHPGVTPAARLTVRERDWHA